MKPSIKITDLDDAVEALERLGGNAAKRALAQAINDVVPVAVSSLQDEANQSFDRPTPFTLNAFRVQYAKPDNPEASVWVKDEKSGSSRGQSPEDWLEPQVFGGDRKLKASERWLREKGILPAGKYITPAGGARLDAYGNMSRGHMMQLLSGLKALGREGSDHSATNSRRSRAKGHANAFFVIRRGSTPIGIGERRGSGMTMVLAFVSQPSYAPRFDFHGAVRKVAENDALLESAIDKAITDQLIRRS